MKKNFFVSAITLGAATLASTLLSAPAKAQVSTTVPITVNIPDIIYLETYTSLTFTPDVTDLTTGSDVTQTVAGTNDFASSNITSPLNGGSAIVFNDTKELNDVIVYKTWGIGGDTGQINHSAAYTGSLIKGSAGSTVGLTVAASAGKVTAAPGLDYANALEGKLDFDFDFTDVKESGSHTGGILTITATAE